VSVLGGWWVRLGLFVCLFVCSFVCSVGRSVSRSVGWLVGIFLQKVKFICFVTMIKRKFLPDHRYW